MSGNTVVDAISASVGVGGLAVAVITYYGSQVLRRKEALFPMIGEFDSCADLDLAKRILDDFVIPEQADWRQPINKYCFIWDQVPGTEEDNSLIYILMISKVSLHKWCVTFLSAKI